MVGNQISAEEKRQALDRVLKSRSFSRSNQLRGFLRYVCDAEIDGREQELNEYALGVAVLGRSSNYSPAEDSCVRTRAHELRQRLESYYSLEAPDDSIRIEIPKGAYVPRFQRTDDVIPPRPVTEGAAEITVAPAIPELALAAQSNRGDAYKRRFLAVALLALLLAAALAVSLIRWKSEQATEPRWTPELAAFWKPFIGNRAPLLISFEIRLFLFSPSTGLIVRDYQTNQLADVDSSKPLSQYRARMSANDMRETSDYADFGAVHASFLLGRLLGTRQREVSLKHSSALGWDDISNSNVIFIGKPNLNPSIRYALKSEDFVDELNDIRNLHPRAGELSVYHNATTHGSGEKYGLITQLPAPRPGHHILILSGAGSELLWALAEYVTDPIHAKELVSHIQLPSGECPDAFQVLIQANFESNTPIRIRYLTHHAGKIL